MTNPKQIIIGTRASPLALQQAHFVRDCLRHKSGGMIDIHIKEVVTKGDEILDRSLELVGGKGLFTEQINHLLLQGDIDIAVHSMKDVETILPQNIAIIATPKREDVRDAFISPTYKTLQDLPKNAIIGTASLRRKAQCEYYRPDCKVTLFRGNVGTRLKKLQKGEADATLLAMAGLNRLNLQHEATEILDHLHFVPAIGQGALAITALDDNAVLKTIIQRALHDEHCFKQITIERYLLALIDGSCHTPIGAYADINADNMVTLHSFYQGNKAGYFTDTFAYEHYEKALHNIANKMRAL